MMRTRIILACLWLLPATALACSDNCPPERTPTPCPTPAVCPPLRAVPDELWPPNHKFVAITLVDPQGNPVSANITGVFQDEPTLVIGSGNFCPDALIEDNAVSVRSERTGDVNIPGDGRVYHIQYSFGIDSTICTGEATVCVPHDQSPGHVCVDQGPLYNSLSCSNSSTSLQQQKAKERRLNGRKRKH